MLNDNFKYKLLLIKLLKKVKEIDVLNSGGI